MKFDIHYLFLAKYAKWIIISLITLFFLMIIFEYATLIFPLANTPSVPSSNTRVEIGKKSDLSDYILDSALFGNYVSDNLNEDNVKKSMLNVTIVGILMADNPENSQVIIRSANGEDRTYKIGDKIPGDAVIKRIIAGGILVERDGTIESLSLPKSDLTFEPVAKPLKEE
jgi:general secretion pathway protein C